MKQIIVIAILILVIIGCRGRDNISVSVAPFSPDEVNAEIESLREFIIPPKGLSKEDVDAVFGASEVITEFTKGSASHYPMNIYQLLTPKPKQEFRAFLYVTYKEGKVTFIGINHLCVTKNRATYPKEEIDVENRRVLEDLIEIKEKYRDKLDNASWNK